MPQIMARDRRPEVGAHRPGAAAIGRPAVVPP